MASNSLLGVIGQTDKFSQIEAQRADIEDLRVDSLSVGASETGALVFGTFGDVVNANTYMRKVGNLVVLNLNVFSPGAIAGTILTFPVAWSVPTGVSVEATLRPMGGVDPGPFPLQQYFVTVLGNTVQAGAGVFPVGGGNHMANLSWFTN